MRAPLRIVFLHPSDELYGADRVLLQLLPAVPDRSMVEIWLPSDLEHSRMPLCERLKADGWTVRHMDLPIMRRAYRNPAGLLDLVRRAVHMHSALRTNVPLVVYCTTSASLLGAPVARLAGVPHIIGHVQELWTGSDRVLLSGPATFCHSLIAISQAVRHSLPRILQSRTAVLLNATPEPDRTSDLTHHSGDLTYVVASRWTSRKGHATLLKAWDRAGCPGQLVVLGGPPPSGDGVDVPSLVSQLGDPASVTVVGEVQDPAPFIDDADVVVVPSDEPEGLGLVAVEAFAHGRPVIASSAGGLVEVVTPGQNGWLYPPGDVESLADILKSLSREPAAAAGRSARSTYEHEFTTERLQKDWTSLLTNALAP